MLPGFNPSYIPPKFELPKEEIYKVVGYVGTKADANIALIGKRPGTFAIYNEGELYKKQESILAYVGEDGQVVHRQFTYAQYAQLQNKE